MLLLTAFSHLIAHPHRLFTSKPHPEERNKGHEKNSRPVSTRKTKSNCKSTAFLQMWGSRCTFTTGTSKRSRPKWEKKNQQYIKAIGDQINVKPLFLSTAFLLSLCSHWESEGRNTGEKSQERRPCLHGAVIGRLLLHYNSAHQSCLQ